MSSTIDATSVSGQRPDGDPADRIVHFDATQPRKERMRKAAAGETSPPLSGATTAPSPKTASAPPAMPPAAQTPVPQPVAVATPAAPAPASPAPAAPAPAAPTANPGLSRADLERVLINFVVEQTGYPAEMVELEADLEADLGIDSIKKAQLFGELAEQFGIQPPADAGELSLDEFPTLGHVANFLEQAAKGASAQAIGGNGYAETPIAQIPAVTQTPAVAQTPVVSETTAPSAPSQPAPSQPAMSTADLEAFLVNFVVEQTGYPAEMVELDADLEADLGIDSIKKAQLFGELAEQFGIQPPSDASEFSLDDFPTLRHIAEFLQGALAGGTNGQPIETAAAPATTAAPTTTATPEAASVSAAVESESANDNDLETFLINFVVEQTGYPVEMVELDADLEADLGIDSIKKAQLFGELAEHFEIQAAEELSLDDFPTLGHVRDFLRNIPRKATV